MFKKITFLLITFILCSCGGSGISYSSSIISSDSQSIPSSKEKSSFISSSDISSSSLTSSSSYVSSSFLSSSERSGTSIKPSSSKESSSSVESSSSIKPSSSKESSSLKESSSSSLISSSSISSSSKSSSSSSSSSSKPLEDKLYCFNNKNAPKLSQKASIFTENITYNIDDLLINFNNVTPYNDGFISVAEDGYFTNKEKLSGIHEITICLSKGNVKLLYGHSIADANEISVSSGTKISLSDNYNYFKILALEDSDITSIEMKYNSKGRDDYNYINVYDSNYNLVDFVEAQIGTTIDVDILERPESLYYEEKEINFLGYSLEECGYILHEYTMTDELYSLYPVYENVQRFSWDHDWINHTYTSNKKGSRAVSEIKGQRYGRASIDFEVTNRSISSVDLLFNLTIGPNSYPYEYRDGTTYFAWHMNPTNGGFQLALCVKDDVYTAGWNVLKYADLSSCSKAWQNYWNSYNNDPTKTLKFNLMTEFTPDSICCYVNDTFVLSYNGEACGYLDSNLVGVRANYGGVIASNFSFTNYVSSSNGFNLFDDGIYVSSAPNIGTVIPEMGGKYGMFKAVVTFTTTIPNSRTGIMVRAAHDDSSNTWVNNSGFYMHHNVTANANFTCSTIYDKIYAKHPDGSSGNIGGVTYFKSDPGYVGTKQVLYDYYSRNISFYKGEIKSLSVKYGFEITKTSLKLFIDGVEIYSNTNTSNVKMFDKLDYIGVGLVAGTGGIRFSEMEWINYED